MYIFKNVTTNNDGIGLVYLLNTYTLQCTRTRHYNECNGLGIRYTSNISYYIIYYYKNRTKHNIKLIYYSSYNKCGSIQGVT